MDFEVNKAYNTSMSRRSFLKSILGIGGALALSSCLPGEGSSKPTPRQGALCAGGTETGYQAQMTGNTVTGIPKVSQEKRIQMGRESIIEEPYGALLFFPQGATKGQWYDVQTVPERSFLDDGTQLHQITGPDSSISSVPYEGKQFCFEADKGPVFERSNPGSERR